MARNKLFGIDMVKTIGNAFKGQLHEGTLMPMVTSTRSASDPTAGSASAPTSHAFEGAMTGDASKNEATGQVEVGDKKFVIIADTIKPYIEPNVGDRILFESVTYAITGLDSDAALAHFKCFARGAD